MGMPVGVPRLSCTRVKVSGPAVAVLGSMDGLATWTRS